MSQLEHVHISKSPTANKPQIPPGLKAFDKYKYGMMSATLLNCGTLHFECTPMEISWFWMVCWFDCLLQMHLIKFVVRFGSKDQRSGLR